MHFALLLLLIFSRAVLAQNLSDTVLIDHTQGFVDPSAQFSSLTEDKVNTAMVQSISDVAKVIGIETIAEFVETEYMRQKLVEMGITYSQGYHIHKPIKLESRAFTETVNQSRL